ncbi:MAG: RHS repeat-associated core domain-containing protein [Anaerolineaceae bacterium]
MLETDNRYTGQREEVEIGLYYYVARWYDPYLNRWIQPDTIIPDPNNPQSYDRYSYVKNNPIRYTDPTGHRDCEECGRDNLHDPSYQENYDYVYNVQHTSDERKQNQKKVETAVKVVEIAASILFEPIDYIFTARDCILGQCSATTLIFAALPLVPSSLTRHTDEVVDIVKRLDETELAVDDALDLAIDFLGNGYQDMGNGRFLSADGLRQVRMGLEDILGSHAGGPHINFENLVPKPGVPGRNLVIDIIHIFITESR